MADTPVFLCILSDMYGVSPFLLYINMKDSTRRGLKWAIDIIITILTAIAATLTTQSCIAH